MKDCIFLFKVPDKERRAFLWESEELPSEVSVIKNGESTDVERLFESHITDFQHQ